MTRTPPPAPGQTLPQNTSRSSAELIQSEREESRKHAIAYAQPDPKYKIHEESRPVPPIISPGTFSTPEQPGKPPSDAIVLFDGTSLDKWVSEDGFPAKWKVENGYAEVVAHTRNIHTKDSFGDCQLHVEFMEPTPPHGEQPGTRQQRRVSIRPL